MEIEGFGGMEIEGIDGIEMGGIENDERSENYGVALTKLRLRARPKERKERIFKYIEAGKTRLGA